MPTPRLSNVTERANEPQGKIADGTLSKETVEAVGGDGSQPNGWYRVRGVLVQGRDSFSEVGDVVTVEWKNGKPYRVVDFDVRRGNTRTHGGGVDLGVVEEVFLAPSEAQGGTVTVWFRNYEQVTELRYKDAPNNRLYQDWAGKIPQTVKWGVNTDVFGVLVGGVGQEVIHVYRIVRTDTKKIISSGVKVTVKEKLGSYTLSTIGPIPIGNVAIHIKRDSVEPYELLVWQPTGPAGTPQAQFDFQFAEFHRDSGTNSNKADVDRSLTMNLTGTLGPSAITFTNGAPIAASQIVVPHGVPETSYRADFGDWGIDELNHPIYTVKVTLNDFGMWQGNSSTGLTGSYHLLGEGTLTNIGLCFIPTCPALDDDVGIQDFMGHGNPSGVISTHIYEVHLVAIDAATATVKWKTLADSTLLQIEETTNGLGPYRLIKDVSMPASPDQCGAPNFGGPAGWRATVPPVAGPQAVLQLGDMGDLATIKSERSLFSQTLPYLPDLPMGNDPTPGTPTRAATTRVTAPFTGYDREWTDFFGVNCSFFIAQEHYVEAHWTSTAADVVRRYDVGVDAKAFVASTGLKWFVVVNRTAQRPPGGDTFNFSTDKHSYGIFVINPTGSSAQTVRGYTDVTDLSASAPGVTFLSANDRHAIWKESVAGVVTWYTVNYQTGVIQVCGNKPPTTIFALAPDLLYSDSEEKPKAIYFVKGWDASTHVIDPTFNDGIAGFPKQDAVLGTIGILKDTKVAATMPDYHVIVDTTLLPLKYRT